MAQNGDMIWDDVVKLGQKLTLDKNGKNATEAGFDKNNMYRSMRQTQQSKRSFGKKAKNFLATTAKTASLILKNPSMYSSSCMDSSTNIM